MEWARHFLSRWKYPEQRVWFVVVAWAAVLIAIVVAASASYSSVLIVHLAAKLDASRTIAFSGTTSSGVLQDNGSVTLAIRLMVTNPSSRSLTFTSVAYKAWIEDLPAEAGLPNLGRSDNLLANETGNHLFFRTFGGSLDVSPVVVSAGDTGAVDLSFQLTGTSDPARFHAVQNITAYAAQVRGNGTAAPWIHWESVVLTLLGLPAPTPTASSYLVSLVRVVIEEGPNIG